MRDKHIGIGLILLGVVAICLIIYNLFHPQEPLWASALMMFAGIVAAAMSIRYGIAYMKEGGIWNKRFLVLGSIMFGLMLSATAYSLIADFTLMEWLFIGPILTITWIANSKPLIIFFGQVVAAQEAIG